MHDINSNVRTSPRSPWDKQPTKLITIVILFHSESMKYKDTYTGFKQIS